MGFGKDGKGAIIRELGTITLGALGSTVSVKSGSQLAIEEDFRIIKSSVLLKVEGMTGNEGPVIIGIADNELTVAEISECLVTDGPLNRSDRGKQEEAERAVFPICIVQNENEMPNNGMPIEKTLRWTFSNTDGWTFFAFNMTTGALTTGGTVYFFATHYGVWVT